MPTDGLMALPTPSLYTAHGGLQLAADTVEAIGGEFHGQILLFPGAGQTRHAWRRSAHTFATGGFDVTSFDLRGHGASAWAADGDYSIDAFVGDVRAILKRMIRPVTLVGASIGGIAAVIALGERVSDENFDEKVRSLVLVDVVPTMSKSGLDHIRSFMSLGSSGFADLEEAAAAVASFLPHRPPRKSNSSLMKNLRQGHDGRLYWHWDPAFHADSQRRAESGMFERMARAAAGVRVPTLIVSGTQSEVVNRTGIDELLASMTNAQAIEVRDASHMVAGDNNEDFVASILEFLRRQRMSLPDASV